MHKCENSVKLERSSIYWQTSNAIQPRASPKKFGSTSNIVITLTPYLRAQSTLLFMCRIHEEGHSKLERRLDRAYASMARPGSRNEPPAQATKICMEFAWPGSGFYLHMLSGLMLQKIVYILKKEAPTLWGGR